MKYFQLVMKFLVVIFYIQSIATIIWKSNLSYVSFGMFDFSYLFSLYLKKKKNILFCYFMATYSTMRLFGACLNPFTLYLTI